MRRGVLLVVLFCLFPIMSGVLFAQNDKAKNPFNFFYNEKLDRYFFNGKKGFVINQSDLGKGTVVEVSVDGGEYRRFSSPIWLKGEGKHHIKYRMVDMASQVLFDDEITVFLDESPPQTSAVYPKETKEVEGLLCFSDPAVFSFSAYDALSGILKIKYSTDGKVFNNYESGMAILKEGEHTLRFRAIDNLGNKEEVNKIKYVFSKVPPETKLDLNPKAVSSGDQLFLGRENTFTLKAVSNGAPIKETVVLLDGQQFIYHQPFQVGAPGKHEMFYYSVDFSGNVGVEKRFAFSVDDTPPKTVFIPSGKVTDVGNLKFVGKGFSLAVEVSDEGSGAKEVFYRFSGDKEYKPYRGLIPVEKSGFQVVAVTSIDEVGNREVPHEISYVVDNAPPETKLVPARSFVKSRGKTYSPFPNIIVMHSEDDLAGIENIWLSLNGSSWGKYAGAFELEEREINLLAFKAEDKLGNIEQPKQLEIGMILPGNQLRVIASEKSGNIQSDKEGSNKGKMRTSKPNPMKN